MKNKIKIGDLVDVDPEVKTHAGLAVIVDQEFLDDERYYTLLWSNGELCIAHRVNIITVI